MILRPSQCLIKSISLKTQKGTFNINNSFLEIFHSLEIYQNMFSPFMTADLILLDGASFVEKNNISGNEEFEIEFIGYGRDEPMKYKFKIAEFVTSNIVSNLRAKQAGLRLVSEEFLTDCSTSISKSYNVGTSDIVKNIIQSFLKSEKPLFVEDSKSIPLIIIPYLSPFKAIDFLRQRTVSESYKSSSFLFFENSDGFFFTTVEGVIDRQLKGNVQEFFQSESISQNVKDGDRSTDINSNHLFFNFTPASYFDLSSIIKKGGIKTNVTQYDLTTKKYQSKVFLNNPSNGLFVDTTLNKNPIVSNEVFQQYSSNNPKPILLPFSKYINSENPTFNFIFDSVAERICFSNLFTQKRIYVDIPGNTLLNAGSVINLKVPRYNAVDFSKSSNEMESGQYLVTACKHSITNADSAKYDTHLELMRIGRGVFET